MITKRKTRWRNPSENKACFTYFDSCTADSDPCFAGTLPRAPNANYNDPGDPLCPMSLTCLASNLDILVSKPCSTYVGFIGLDASGIGLIVNQSARPHSRRIEPINNDKKNQPGWGASLEWKHTTDGNRSTA